MVTELRRRETGFTSLHENLDTATRGGRLVSHVFAALSKTIRELIVSGIREGLAAACVRGKVGGTSRTATPHTRAWGLGGLRAAGTQLPPSPQRWLLVTSAGRGCPEGYRRRSRECCADRSSRTSCTSDR
ncbi:recombinase family protein [Streptomyces sp. NPDC021100]|uniref:recombinase family protein n=1 Tax=Streptomyces sp. NPDC021100 TaxID=3365114 RepID=UPI0037B720E0